MRGTITLIQVVVLSGMLNLSAVAADQIKDATVPAVGSDLSHLRIKRIIPMLLRLRIKEIRDGKLILGKRQTLLNFGILPTSEDTVGELGVGDRVPKTNYVITQIKPKTREDPDGSRRDVSEIGIRNVRTGFETVFQMNQVVNMECAAELESADGRTKYPVQIRDKIEFPKGSGRTYEVTEIKLDQGVFLRSEKGEVFRIAMPQSAQ